MNKARMRMAAPVGAGATGRESLDGRDSSFTLALFSFLEVSPRVSRARVANTMPDDFEQVRQEELKRHSELARLRKWSLDQVHCLASQERRNRFRRVWLGSRWGEAA